MYVLVHKFLTEAVHWIKEVEMVDSVDDLMSSSSIRGISMPNFEVLDGGLLQHRIIHNTQFKRKVSLEEQKAQKVDRFFRGRQIAYFIYEYFLFTGANDSVENYADLFTNGLRNDDIQEFKSKWDEILLSTTKIPPDDILVGLYKLRKRESEKLKTVLELYDLEIHQKNIGPDYHRLKTIVKRSIEQDIRINNFGARNGNYERNAVVKNPGTKQRVQRIFGDCWQWEANGQCSKGDNCSFRHDINKRGNVTPSNPSPNSFMQQSERKSSRTRSPEEEVPVVECFDGPARITSKELSPIHSVKSGTLQNACSTRPRVVVGLEKSAVMHIVRLMNNLVEGPKRMMTKVQ